MPSTPALLEMTVRFLTPESRIASDQGLGDAAETEAAGHDRHAVLEDAFERRFGVGVNLVHATVT